MSEAKSFLIGSLALNAIIWLKIKEENISYEFVTFS